MLGDNKLLKYKILTMPEAAGPELQGKAKFLQPSIYADYWDLFLLEKPSSGTREAS